MLQCSLLDLPPPIPQQAQQLRICIYFLGKPIVSGSWSAVETPSFETKASTLQIMYFYSHSLFLNLLAAVKLNKTCYINPSVVFEGKIVGVRFYRDSHSRPSV